MTDTNTVDPVVVQPTQPQVDPATPPVNPVTPVNPGTVVDKVVEVKPAFGDDWRQQLAGTDDKDLAWLSRFPDAKALWGSFKEAQKKISSGELKKPLSANPTPEELAQHRKDFGVPDTVEGYEYELSDGMVIGEADTAIVNAMKEVLHNENIPSKAFNSLVNAFFEARQEEAAIEDQRQEQIQFDSEEILRKDWGGNYLPNMFALKNFLSAMPNGLGEELLNARLSDGSKVGNNAEAIRALTAVALDINPAGTVVPGSSGNQVQAVQDEIAQIEHVMNTNLAAYHKDTEMKARYLKLLDARLKLQKRAG